MTDDFALDPESIEALRAFTEETVARRAHLAGGRTASQVINEDPSPRPYSVPLTAREIHMLRVLARATGQKPSELARRFLLDGMLRLEEEMVEPPAEKKELAYYMALPYSLTLVPDPSEPGYAIKVNELPGCISQGDTPDEAVRRIREAMEAWLATALEDGAAIPEPRGR